MNRFSLIPTRPLHRLLLAIMVVVAVLGGFATADRITTANAIHTEMDRADNVARLAAASYRQQVGKFQLVTTTLSADPDVGLFLRTRSPDAARRLNVRLAGLSAALDASVIYLLDGHGRTMASSNWAQPDSFLGRDYSFRQYFKGAMAQGQRSQYALGTQSRIPGLYLARRVAMDPAFPGVIVVKIRFDRLEREWARLPGPAFVANDKGVILISSRPDWRFQTIGVLTDAEKQRIRAQVEFGNAPLQQNHFYRHGRIVNRPAGRSSNGAYVESIAPLADGW
ncbi:MAG: cache domain-containing protein, partial [Sphingopyxis sp.]